MSVKTRLIEITQPLGAAEGISHKKAAHPKGWTAQKEKIEMKDQIVTVSSVMVAIASSTGIPFSIAALRAALTA